MRSNYALNDCFSKKAISLAIIAACFAWLIIMLGAYTRLTDAGLGCPDWPGCYGRLILPSVKNERILAQNRFPTQPIEARKAWTEMIHRYAAGSLIVFIFMLVVFSWKQLGLRARMVLGVLLSLLCFQAALGMWTVTLKLLPLVVMGHLLGGILIFGCLVALIWHLSPIAGENLPVWRYAILGGIFLVFCQIALGGWVSSNYAGIACVGFPQCNGMWWPDLFWLKSFNLLNAIGVNHQGGILDNEARVTIQMVHRLGAVIVASYILGLSGLILAYVRLKPLRTLASVTAFVVLVQFTLGIVNVIYLLPLWAAVLHNGVAAILLGCLISMHYFTRGPVHA